MTNILKSKYKACRRLSVSIWGDAKDPFLKGKNTKPGQHGSGSYSKSSYFGAKLKAKQQIKAHYGRVSEKQMRKTFEKAKRMKGNSAQNFLALMERRLDMVVYRLNLAPTIFAARQLVSHKHIMVNDQIVNIASFKVKAGDVVSLSKKSILLKEIKAGVESSARTVPGYLTNDTKNFRGTVVSVPHDISEIPIPFEANINLLVEQYS
ncbi:30S ribosomal protein S4 [Candidatus Sneabacter namystus]|uniref:Small ribosomal subunit protein uS4 n=1 Tax=Candidatus Sneabacter namystus TaxID=2601646 RepID=A0A5C0UIM8_9RICK|nr:30S ribosomal protein S4 [Candidatus Sneabacter namystus]QEK39610.1 30S ribosomal protein S4 [Candidatus Sneabacter namystus]